MGDLIWRFFKLEPALVRGILVGIAGVIAVVFGRTVVDDNTITLIIELFASISALIAVLWVRGAVTANAKVVVRNDTPFEDEPTLAAGDSSVTTLADSELREELVIAAAEGSE
jgi:hypothetical protein